MKKHFYWLDVLRALAMLEVLSSHYRNVLFPAWGEVAHSSGGGGVQLLYALTKWGHSAVIVFFVLSGFLVGGKSIERAMRDQFDVIGYAKNRCERILPPLALMCLIVPFMFLSLGIAIPWGSVWGNLFSLQGLCCKPLLGPWWALSVEVWFYVWCGAALGAWRAKGWLRFACAGILALMSFIFIRGSIWFLLIWLLGAATYFVLPRTKNIWRLLGSVVACSALAVVGSRVSANAQIADFFLGVGLCLIVREVVMWEPSGIVSRAANKFGTWLSAPSYSIYLSHMLAMIILANLIFTPAANATVDREYMVQEGIFASFTKVGIIEICALIGSLALSIIFGWLVYLVAEKPWWKNLLRRNTENRSNGKER